MKLSKSDIRMGMRLRLGTLAKDRRATASEVICSRVREQACWQSAKAVLLFVPLPDEPDVWPLVQEALATGKQVALPRFSVERQIYTARVICDLEKDLEPGHYGILEPRRNLAETPVSEVDFALLPGVAFDVHGHRLGRGKGYYDRLLSEVRGRRCGVAFEFQITPELPVEPHDVVMDCLATEAAWREFVRP